MTDDMPIELLYHDPDSPGATSPFDRALLRIARKGIVRLASPYIGLGYLRRITGLSRSWCVLTDIEEWLRSQSQSQRERAFVFLTQNRDRFRHYPRLHAKVAIGSNSAMLGSANFTSAGILQRTEVSVFFQDEPQVEELSNWFEVHWRRAYELNNDRMGRIATLMNHWPQVPMADNPPDPELDPPISSRAASLVQISASSKDRSIAKGKGDFYVNYGHEDGWRVWDDARSYGFICAGGGREFSEPLDRLRPGHRIWVYAPRYGYVGVARITGTAQPATDFRVRTPSGRMRPIMAVVTAPHGYHIADIGNPERCEYFVPVRWVQTVSVDDAVFEEGFFAIEWTVCCPTSQRWHDTLIRLRTAFPNYNR